MRTTISTMIVADLVLPITAYYALRAMGVGELVALVCGTVLAASRVVIGAVRARRVDAIAFAVSGFFAVSLVALLLSDDARLALAVNSIPTALMGLWCFASLVIGRPLAFTLFLPLLTRGEQNQEPFWHRAWAEGVDFRHALRVITIGWGCLLIIEAAVRLIFVWEVPVDVMVGVSNGMQAALVALILGFTGWQAKTTGLGVGAYLKSIEHESTAEIEQR